MHDYLVQIKTNGVVIKTIIHAENQLHAKLLAQYQYGIKNVVSTPIKIG